MYLESTIKRIFCHILSGKKVSISYGNLLLFRINFAIIPLKIILFRWVEELFGIFHRVKELFKSNQTGYGVYHVYLESKTNRTFAIASLGKKLVLHTEICDYFQYLIFRFKFFIVSRNYSNTTKVGMEFPHMYLESTIKRIFCHILSRKKVSISYGNLLLFRINFAIIPLKIILFRWVEELFGIFHRVKELFKSNQTGYGVYHVYLESKTNRTFAIASLGKKLVLHTEICDYFQYLIFRFKFFIGSRNYSNTTKVGMEFPMCT